MPKPGTALELRAPGIRLDPAVVSGRRGCHLTRSWRHLADASSAFACRGVTKRAAERLFGGDATVSVRRTAESSRRLLLVYVLVRDLFASGVARDNCFRCRRSWEHCLFSPG